ncbi:MAG TPA: LysR substrate-binding domain-containing protein [Roseiarcus sp.]|nr:LysR substrate-binding domain-containing protein [Roseiarcus sp.]
MPISGACWAEASETGANMDLRKLRYFAGVVEAKSISKAAEALHVAQPALSKSVRALELDLETPLLERSAQGVTTTEAGARLYEHCQLLFKQIARARLDVRKSVEKPSGLVTIGMPHSLMSVLALPLLDAMTKFYPDVRLELKQEQSHLLANAVRSNKLDCAAMASQQSHAGLVCRPLLVEELFFIEPRRAAQGGSEAQISFAEASRRQFVLPAVGNGLRAYIEGHFRARSLPLDVRYEIDAIALMTQCVDAGLGVSLLPGGCLQRDAYYPRMSAKSFAEGGCHRHIVLSHSADGVLNPAAARALALLEDVARGLVARGQWLGGRAA